jgi:ABC-type proline/glycine betaine transport system permease subunit
MDFPALPLSDVISAAVRWMQLNLGGLFSVISAFLTATDDVLRAMLGALPAWLIIGLVIALLALRRRFVEAIGLAVALLVIENLGLWRAAIDTISLVAIASAISILFGAPLGVLIAESRFAKAVVTPALDYMQTTPAFVYLIPAVLFFGIGTAPGVFATAAFALPPVARTLALGLEQVSPQAIEAGESFGSSRFQILVKIKFPLALPYFRVGLNQ